MKHYQKNPAKDLSKEHSNRTRLQIHNNGTTTNIITKAFDAYEKIIEIESIAINIAGNQDDLFKKEKDKNGRTSITPSKLAKRLILATKNDFTSINKELEGHRQNPIYEAFADTCTTQETEKTIRTWNIHGRFSQKQEEKLNQLAEEIKTRINSPEIKKKLQNHRRSSNKNTLEIKKYIDALFEKHSRVLAIRIDLGYRHKLQKNTAKEFNYEDAKSHRESLFKYIKKDLKDKLVGFIWKLEYGTDRGFHYHILLLLDGSKSREDISIAQKFGKHWDEIITEGSGYHFNCNADKSAYRDKLGIGMISHHEAGKIENLKSAAIYLTKPDYYATFIAPDSGRTLGKGNFPTPKKFQKGRPRKLQPT